MTVCMCCNIRTLIKSSTNNFEKDSKRNSKINFKNEDQFRLNADQILIYENG